jgi:hypothetical protein
MSDEGEGDGAASFVCRVAAGRLRHGHDDGGPLPRATSARERPGEDPPAVQGDPSVLDPYAAQEYIDENVQEIRGVVAEIDQGTWSGTLRIMGPDDCR